MDKTLLVQSMQKGNTYPATWDEFYTVFSKVFRVVTGESVIPFVSRLVESQARMGSVAKLIL